MTCTTGGIEAEADARRGVPPGWLPESIKSEDRHRREDARYEDPGVEDGRLHLRRTLRKAR